MSGSGPEAVVILIDNSASSRNGDFSPTRLHVQTDAVRQLIKHLVASSAKTEVAVGGIATCHVSLTTVTRTDDGRVSLRALDDFMSQGVAEADRAIRCSLLRLHQRDKSIRRCRIILLIASNSEDLSTPDKCQKLKEVMECERVGLDIVAFGDDVVQSCGLLSGFSENASEKCECRYVYCPTGTSLTEAIYRAGIVPHDGQTPSADADVDDPELQQALAASMEDGGDDYRHVWEAVQASMDDQEALRLAMQASLEEQTGVPNDDSEEEEVKDNDVKDK